MSMKGSGLGLDVLKRMQPERDLNGTWVIFDVMHCITTGWLMFSAHVYDITIELCVQFSLASSWPKIVNLARLLGGR
jgi:hypothetical protein